MSTENHIHYVVFYLNGEIKQIDDIELDKRLDKELVFKRTFIKPSGGKGEYSYHTTEVQDKELIPLEDKTFEFGKVKCKIIKEQYWAAVRKGYNPNAMFMDFEITDLLGRTEIKRIEFKEEIPSFQKLKNYLELVNRVGTLQGANEIEYLQSKINQLKIKKA